MSFHVIKLKLFVFLSFFFNSTSIQFFISIIIPGCFNVESLDLIITFKFITFYDYVELSLHFTATILYKMI